MGGRGHGRRMAALAAAVALLIAGGVGLLLERALSALSRERRAEHAAVAGRVFDELERELTAIVEPEEQRPFAQYRSHYVAEDQVKGNLAFSCSPLAEAPREDWLVGHFQIDPDGRFSTPLAGEDQGYVDDPVTDELRRCTAAWRAPEPAETADIAYGSEASQQVLQQVDVQLANDAPDQPAQTQLLNKLNRGFGSRAGYRSKGETVTSWSANSFANNDVALDQQAVQTAQVGPAEADDVAVSITPFAGRVVDGDRLVLTRSVRVGARDFRQGFALRLPELTAWLDRRVLADDAELRSAVALEWPGLGGAAPPAEARYAFRHVFAPPFADLAAVAHLQPIVGPSDGERGLVWALGGALVVVAAVGFLAIARAIGAAVSYAQRTSDFVSAVTHELKTPLTSIRLYGEMLRDGMARTDADRAKYHATITSEAERLSRLIGNVLELARLEKGDRPMAWRVGAPADVLGEAAEVCAPHARALGFVLEVRCADGLPAVRYDRDALTQVVINLVDNALKFAREAAEKVVALEARSDGAGGVRILVGDRGPGVPSAHLAKIFQPFFRGERELTRTTTGTGIGLSLVKGLVERMGGRVSARNRDGGGFEVEIALPVVA